MTRTTACVAAPAFLGAFDFGLLAIAGPRVADAVGATGPAYPWLFSTSSFAYGACVIPAAALTARVGPSRALALGLMVAPLGLLALAAADAPELAFAGRALLGVGGALAATAALALLSALTDPAARRSAASALGGAVGGGFAVGALLGGTPSWRVVLIALSLACLVVAAVALRLARAGVVHGAQAPAHGGAGQRADRVRAAGGARSSPVRGGAWLALAIVVAGVALARPDGEVVLVGVAVGAGLAVVGLRRASGWLPRPRGPLARAYLAGAATTASGVSATILAGAVLASEGMSGALLGVFGLAVLPGARLARSVARRAGHAVAAAVGLLLQGVGLAALAAVFATGLEWPAVAAAIVVFGVGHVAANAGAAGAVTALGGPAAVGALLVAAQYLGGGLAPVVIVGRVEDPSAGVLVAAFVAVLGAVATWPRSSASAVVQGTELGLSARRAK